MTVAAFTFYLFAIIAVASGLFVTISRNPLHSVLWLILTFLSAAGLFVTMGAEFVAMLLIIVYVGAVAVLFLFVVMMLDVDFSELKAEMARYMPLGLLVGVILLVQLGVALGAWKTADMAQSLRMSPMPDGMTNTEALGMLIYAPISLPVPDGGADLAGGNDRGDPVDAAPSHECQTPERDCPDASRPGQDDGTGGCETGAGVVMMRTQNKADNPERRAQA